MDESILDLYDSHAQHGLQKEHNRLKALVADTLFLEGSYILPSGAVQGGWLGLGSFWSGSAAGVE